MRRFLVMVSVFLAVSYVALLGLDLTYSHYAARSNNVYIESWFDLINGDIDAEVIAVGNSRMWHHVNPAILDSVLCVSSYNLGMDGSPINRQVRKYNVFRKHNKKPKLIIQNIDFVSMEYGIGVSMEQFLPYFWDKPLREDLLAFEPVSFTDKWVPLYRYHGYDLRSFLRFDSHKLYKGYDPVASAWDGGKLKEIDSISFESDERTEKIFDSFLTKAKEEGISVVFVYTPIYLGATQRMTNSDEMHSKYQFFADKYGIPVLDYTEMEICADTSFFFNAMHLNQEGAKLFSAALAHDIDSIFFCFR